eukprot:4567065-Alexandrium_andersonii.AAC.1
MDGSDGTHGSPGRVSEAVEQRPDRAAEPADADPLAGLAAGAGCGVARSAEQRTGRAAEPADADPPAGLAAGAGCG